MTLKIMLFYSLSLLEIQVDFVEATYRVGEGDGNVTVMLKKEGRNEIPVTVSVVFRTMDDTAVGKYVIILTDSDNIHVSIFCEILQNIVFNFQLIWTTMLLLNQWSSRGFKIKSTSPYPYWTIIPWKT